MDMFIPPIMLKRLHTHPPIYDTFQQRFPLQVISTSVMKFILVWGVSTSQKGKTVLSIFHDGTEQVDVVMPKSYGSFCPICFFVFIQVKTENSSVSECRL